MLAPGARLALLVQVTFWPLKVQEKPPVVRVPVQLAVTPAGRASRTVVVPVVGLPPALLLFLTVNVYLAPLCPTTHGPLLVLLTLGVPSLVLLRLH